MSEELQGVEFGSARRYLKAVEQGKEIAAKHGLDWAKQVVPVFSLGLPPTKIVSGETVTDDPTVAAKRWGEKNKADILAMSVVNGVAFDWESFAAFLEEIAPIIQAMIAACA